MTLPSGSIDDKSVLTVYQLNQAAGALLEKSFGMVWVKGELSNLAAPRSGHLYFTLKDADAQVRCALFKGNSRRLGFTPQEGEAVLLRATVSIYEGRGDYQLIVNHMEKWGVGALQAAYEALKAKLQAQGLFDAKTKKPLPRFPRHIGVVTSHTGAAIQDILSVLKRRYPIAQISIYHTPVQGKSATSSIVAAIKMANQHALAEVLIVARGGGSLEDLWCFNEEPVARAIFDSHIPIVTGIGHEVDFTIADFVADYRAPTPSAAAETVTPDRMELIQLFEQQRMRLDQAMLRQLQVAAFKLDGLEKQLIHPDQRLQQAYLLYANLQQRLNLSIEKCLICQKNRLSILSLNLKSHSPDKSIQRYQTLLKHSLQQLYSAMKQQLQAFNEKWGLAGQALQNVSPLATLSRGYAIVTVPRSHEIVRSIAQVSTGDELIARFVDGTFECTVNQVLPLKEEGVQPKC